MTSTIARIKKAGKHFEIMVDMDKALAFKKNTPGVSVGNFLESDDIYTDLKKGNRASDEDMKSSFGTTDVNEIASRLVKEGEVQTTQEHRSEVREVKYKQVVDFLSRNAIDAQTRNPITAERIRSALDESGVNIKNVPLENQINEIIESLSKIIPIKLETKKFKVVVPAIYTGKSYGVVNQYKEKEDWLNNGDLQVMVNVPAGLVMDFFDKLNSVTHGSALSEEIKE